MYMDDDGISAGSFYRSCCCRRRYTKNKTKWTEARRSEDVHIYVVVLFCLDVLFRCCTRVLHVMCFVTWRCKVRSLASWSEWKSKKPTLFYNHRLEQLVNKTSARYMPDASKILLSSILQTTYISTRRNENILIRLCIQCKHFLC